MNDKEFSDHAVVLGGSIARLLAARVLAEAYARVTVVERDDLSSTLCLAAAYRRAGTSTV